MAAITTSSDGKYIFLGLQDSNGDSVVLSALRTDLSTFTASYAPATGTASNVLGSPSDPDVIYFYGNYGTNIVIQTHTISTATTTDISPSSLGAKVVNTLNVNPADVQQITASVDTDEDLTGTTDSGSNWTAWDSSLGFDATGLSVLWSGQYFPHRYLVGGEVGAANLDLLYSPNAGANSLNKEGVALGLLGDISGVETVEV